MTTKTENIAASVVFPVAFNKNIDVPKSASAKTTLGIFGKRYLDLGAAKNPHKTVAASGNIIIRKYFIPVFSGK